MSTLINLKFVMLSEKGKLYTQHDPINGKFENIVNSGFQL